MFSISIYDLFSGIIGQSGYLIFLVLREGTLTEPNDFVVK